jgi:hypothetical protein
MDPKSKERYTLMYQKAQQLGGRATKTIRTFEIGDIQCSSVNPSVNSLFISKPLRYEKIHNIFI